MMRDSRNGISGAALAAIVVAIVIIAGAAVYYSTTSPPITTTSSTSSSSSSIRSSSSTSLTSTSAISSSKALQKVSVMMDFPVTAYHSMFFYGLDHGMYANNGIDLTILPGNAPPTTAAAVAQGKVDFGLVDFTSLVIVAGSQNVSNLRMVAMIHQRTPLSIIYNTATIHSIKDLNNKTYGTFQGSTSFLLFRILAAKNNFSLSSIKVISAQPATYSTLVALGQADFVTTAINQFPSLAPIAAQHNIKLGNLPYADNGIDILGFGIIATTDMIKNHPDLVKAFVDATLRSFVTIAHNPSDGIASLVKYNPQLNATLQLPSFGILLRTSDPDINSTVYSQNPLKFGWMNPVKVQTTTDISARAIGLSKVPNYFDLYTNDFVQQP